MVVVDDQNLRERHCAEPEVHPPDRAQRRRLVVRRVLAVVGEDDVERLVHIRLVVVVDRHLEVLDHLPLLKHHRALARLVVPGRERRPVVRLKVDRGGDAQREIVGDAPHRDPHHPGALDDPVVVGGEHDPRLKDVGHHRRVVPVAAHAPARLAPPSSAHVVRCRAEAWRLLRRLGGGPRPRGPPVALLLAAHGLLPGREVLPPRHPVAGVDLPEDAAALRPLDGLAADVRRDE
mmetsp:Transcript_10155/g.24239  ORF Transcript_10155/g.24239 Transcript_10155/m.24239 type:complete len:234 (-) Transcript_10155:1127-1828(-)